MRKSLVKPKPLLPLLSWFYMNFRPLIFKSAIIFDCLMTIVHLEYQQDRNATSNITTQQTTQLQTPPHPQRQLHLLDITAGQILSVTLSSHHPQEGIFRNLITGKSFNHEFWKGIFEMTKLNIYLPINWLSLSGWLWFWLEENVIQRSFFACVETIVMAGNWYKLEAWHYPSENWGLKILRNF